MKTEEITAAASRWGDLIVERTFGLDGVARKSRAAFKSRIHQARRRGLRAEGIRKSY